MTLPDPIITKASGGVMAETGKEASCERGSGAEVVHTSAKGADRRDHQEIPMTDTDVRGPTREEIIAFLRGEGMLEDCWFGEKHPSHSGYFWWRKYLDRLRSPGGDGEMVAELVAACKHALKLLEPFDDPELSLGLGSNALSTIRTAIAKAEAASAGEKKCACGGMSEQDCNDLPSLRHCGGATSAEDPPCGDPSCNQDRERKMVKTGHTTASGRPVFCDPCIAPVVQALNDAGIHTVASCCGHGHRPGAIALADGRWLVIARNDVEYQIIERIFPTDINGTPADRAAGREDV